MVRSKALALVFTIAFAPLLTGCSATQTVSDWGRSLVSRGKPAQDDPLVLDKSSVSKEYAAAEEGLENPDRANLAFARWKEDMGQYSEAKARYREVLTANPENLNARLGIARVEYETGRVSAARQILQDASERHPNSSEVWLELGRIHGEQERWDEAIASFQKAADIDSTDQVARYELGIALARADRPQEAYPHLEYSVGESAAMYNIGYVLHEKQRNAEAVSWFTRALESHPDDRTKAQSKQMLARLGVNPDPARTEAIARRAVAPAPNPFAMQEQTRSQPQVQASTVSSQSHVAEPTWSNSTNEFEGGNAIQRTSGSVESGRAVYSIDNTPQWRGPTPSKSTAAPAINGTVQPQEWRPRQ